MNKMTDTGLHFRVECAMCGDSLVAESSRLAVLVVAAQEHFIVDHDGESLSGRQILESKSLMWQIDEVPKRGKMLVRPLEGRSFRTILSEVTKQSEEAANLPPLERLLKH
jgi:hypothetical protein